MAKKPAPPAPKPGKKPPPKPAVLPKDKIIPT